MREIGNCGKAQALPSNVPQTLEGKAGSDDDTELRHFRGETACKKVQQRNRFWTGQPCQGNELFLKSCPVDRTSQ